MTDTSTRPAPGTATRWERHSPLRTAAELSLGLSFAVTTAFGGYSAATGQLAVVSQVAGIVFVVTLTCVLVSWFRAVDHEESHSAQGPRRTPASTPAAAGTPAAVTPADSVVSAARTSVDVVAPAAAHPLSVIDAEYRR